MTQAMLSAAVAAWPAGSGRVVVRRVAGASSVITAEATDPLKFLVNTARGACAWVYSTTYGGGLVAGDRIAMAVDVEPGAQLYLGTQASTKVYRSEGAVARQEISATVGAGGLLVALPDPVTPFTAARFAQTQTIDCAAGADVVWSDGLTCGRAARDERWDFTSYTSSLTLRVDDRPLLRDNLRLQAGLRSVRERLPEIGALATLIIGGPGMSALCTKARALVAAQPLAHPLRMTLSPLGTWGVLLRAATVEREVLEQTVRDLLCDLCPRLGDDPWQRRP